MVNEYIYDLKMYMIKILKLNEAYFELLEVAR